MDYDREFQNGEKKLAFDDTQYPENSGVNVGHVQPCGGPPGLNTGPAQQVHPFVPQFGGESNDEFRQQPPPLGTHTPSKDNLSQRGNPGVLTKISGWVTGSPTSQVRMAARQKLEAINVDHKDMPSQWRGDTDLPPWDIPDSEYPWKKGANADELVGDGDFDDPDRE